MNIFPIKALQDNYIWSFIVNKNQMWVVDPGEARPVIEHLKASNAKLAGVLLTHHHYDHTGGVEELLNYDGSIKIISSHRSTIRFINQSVKEGDKIDCGPIQFNVFEIPGHTLDHLAFYNDDVLFCGDTLFSGGCGKVFEGTDVQMYQSLMKLRSLPGHTNLYCGHEYTLANLMFAKQVEPENGSIENKLKITQALRDNHQPSLPSLLSDEIQINPFFRCDQQTVINAAEKVAQRKLMMPADVFSVIREWKNKFKS